MTGHVKYLFDVATLKRERRDGRISREELGRRLVALIHDTTGIERPDPTLDRYFDEAVQLANGGRS